MSLKIQKVTNGMPTFTENQEQFARCCDCGLVHLLKVRTIGKEFEIVAYRNDYLTDLAKSKRKADKRKRGRK